MSIWDQFGDEQYLSLVPWARFQLVSAGASGPFSFIGGVAPEVVDSLQKAYGLLINSVEAAMTDAFAGKASLEDPMLRARVEDAYAELVMSRQDLRAHIRCGRERDGTFRWEFPVDPAQRPQVNFSALQLVNGLTKQTTSLDVDSAMTPAVGKLLGVLQGTHRVSEVRQVTAAVGPQLEMKLIRLLETLNEQQCVTASAHASVRAYWLANTHDRDTVHLGHAGLLYRQRDGFLLFDPWLVPWFAEAPVPSLWGGSLPKPTAIFLTHEHSDHLDQRTLLQMPKDIPVIVPSRKNRRTLYYDYRAILGAMGFTQVVELAHGERWGFDGGVVEAVPFYGEDPCDLELPRNCYLIADRGHNTLVHADSGPTNDGRSPVKEGVIDHLVRRNGPILTVFASQQQLLEVRARTVTASLSPPGHWLERGENGYLTSSYLGHLVAGARARLFVSYATGGADWFPASLPFVFSSSRPAGKALLAANWERMEELGAQLRAQDCDYHVARALDIFRVRPNGGTQVVDGSEQFDPSRLFGVDASVG